MSQDPRGRTDICTAASPRDPIRTASETTSSRRAIQQEIKDISQTLVAHGAGSVSTELALDLVLHEIVVEAREATRATAAAIAWLRQGEMVCRATTGANAPQLGIRIEVESALVRACMSTGHVQVSRDASLAPTPAGGAYQPLGVHSILLAPIANQRGEILGLLHLFSSVPDAFGENEIHATQAFVTRCIEARTEAEEWGKEAESKLCRTELAGNVSVAVRSNPIREAETAFDPLKAPSSRSKAWDLSNFILLLAVLTVAIVLGWLLGWHKGTQQSSAPSNSPAFQSSQVPIVRESAVAAGSSSIEPSTPTGSTLSANPVPDHASGETPGVPPGGLIIIEDGKVIYRGGEPTVNPSIPPSRSKQVNGLLHRVNPQYPPEAIARNIEGPVVLDVGVRGNGSVGDVAVRSGDPLLAEAAVRAVKQWRFAASSAVGDRNGRQTSVTIRFTLSAK